MQSQQSSGRCVSELLGVLQKNARIGKLVTVLVCFYVCVHVCVCTLSTMSKDPGLNRFIYHPPNGVGPESNL